MTSRVSGRARLASAPTLSADDARRTAREVFGVTGDVQALTSERDQNWRVGDRVLKVANAAESAEMLDAQQAMIAWIARRGDATIVPLIPRVIPTTEGEPIRRLAHDGDNLAWMISMVPGRAMAHAGWRSPELLRDLGRVTGALTEALDGFEHPAAHRDFYWDVANARRVVGEYRKSVLDDVVAAAIDRIAEAFDRDTAPLLPDLQKAVVHGDLNDHNVLVGGGDAPESRDQRVTGIVDFGDLVHSYRVADLAIAVAYVMAASDDPLLDAREVVRGHHARLPLGENEIAALFGLAAMRLCASACIAAVQQAERPDNEYLSVTQPHIRRTLPLLADIPFAYAEAVLRDACGLEPAPRHTAVVEWLRANAASVRPVMGVAMDASNTIVLDWSIASPLLGADEGENAEPVVTERTFGAMRRAGATMAVGRYDEPRLLYVSSAFAAGGRITDERRTVHIGLDLFAEAGAPVYAPLDGVVHAFNDNDAACDYGPVIVLEHVPEGGPRFFTLYGHLSRESLAGLRVGMPVRAGERIAWLGAPAVNGNWTPHVHLQINTDMLGLGTDFPGVARPSFRDIWLSLCPDPNLIAQVPSALFPSPAPSKEETLHRRRATFGGNLSLAYREPVRIVRGWKQYLFDDEGRRYVDAYNNVPHVGHCHPRVVEAAAVQMRVLNTNTRYLNDVVNEYAERLAATLPPPLRVVYLVNSASEANELALRLARAHTGARDTIVVEGAYHGNTTSLIDISPYKHAARGGTGAPDWVHTVPLADDYRGPHKRGDPAAAAKYAAHVGAVIGRLGAMKRRLAAFIAETCPSVGGQIMFPPGYLADVHGRVREAGGVTIADEVQTGLGRIGTHCWAFEAQGVVPDIVVMGKPLGNGHPIGAVVTTREIARSFDNGMEYFSTFGGNTVSCAVGLAVLDVLRDERLQAHAHRVGARMLDGLRPLVDRYPLVGDVRGSGLFLGVELVRDRETLEPAGAEASFVVNRMRERGVLAGTDGPYHNVVKIRPPMPIAEADGDLIVAELARGVEMLS